MSRLSDIFYISWQDPDTRRWFTVGQLYRGDKGYTFQYTRGAERSGRFKPFASFSNIRSIYISEILFPFFSNRVLSERRPEYERYAAWSGLQGGNLADPLLLMALMGGGRATDTLQVYKKPARTASGNYSTVFFCHGIRHMTEGAQLRSTHLDDAERLYPMFDVQNEFDLDAVALRTRDPAALVGYCPRYIARDMRLLGGNSDAHLCIRVRKTNHDAPPQFRLLVEAEACWPAGFQSCGTDECEPVVQADSEKLLSQYAERNAERLRKQNISRDMSAT